MVSIIREKIRKKEHWKLPRPKVILRAYRGSRFAGGVALLLVTKRPKSLAELTILEQSVVSVYFGLSKDRQATALIVELSA